jgi:hypothetical protein
MPQCSVIFWKLLTNLCKLLKATFDLSKIMDITKLRYGFTNRYLQKIMCLFCSYGS